MDVSSVEGIKVKRLSFLDRDVSSWRIFRPEIDAEKCVGCRRCYIFCPEVAISMAEGKAVINYQHCKGCGICFEECPAKAISFEEEAI
ncbi:MAG: 4Fe-4S binding protein [Candidatus Bathyarchaeota archaeon]|nr:4Fe-4S binding protein [Candidatus Bathyarchaeota archaeon]MDH5792213.1 4Fe-4S binding protein [Candidatus Bathyarchaeota archaeon]